MSTIHSATYSSPGIVGMLASTKLMARSMSPRGPVGMSMPSASRTPSEAVPEIETSHRAAFAVKA